MARLDMMGKPCPIPVIEAKKAMGRLAVGESLEILVDNDTARQNLQKMARGKGYGFAHAKQPGGILVTLQKLAEGDAAGPGVGAFVVAIGKNTMGQGDDELGRMLMKSFLFSLTELDTPPEHLLFYNGGVHLTTEGSAALDDLRALEAKGTAISSCGACLSFYGLTDKLSVGSVTNMFAIAQAMAEAERLVNL